MERRSLSVLSRSRKRPLSELRSVSSAREPGAASTRSNSGATILAPELSELGGSSRESVSSIRIS